MVKNNFKTIQIIINNFNNKDKMNASDFKNIMKDNYTFHIATLAFRTEIEIPLTYIHNNGNLDIIQIKADLAKYFDGVHAYSLKTEIPASHSNIAQAPYINKLRANIQQMFSAKQN